MDNNRVDFQTKERNEKRKIIESTTKTSTKREKNALDYSHACDVSGPYLCYTHQKNANRISYGYKNSHALQKMHF